MTLQDHLDALTAREGLEDLFFGAHELLSREFFTLDGKRVKSRKRVVPPCDKFGNIDLTILAASEIRRRMGEPVVCWCAYRTEDYNRELGNEDDSQHVRFGAMDLGSEDLPRLRAETIHVMERLHHEGFDTGLGHYRWGVHIDVGASKPGRRRWRFPRDLKI